MNETVIASATRIVNATCDNVWRTQTDPRHFEQWFGARSGTVKVDARTGGSWCAVVVRGAEEIKVHGRYLEVVDHHKLVMTVPNGSEDAEVTIVLTDMGDRTEITSSTPSSG